MIIADSGGTKTEWAIVNRENGSYRSVFTQGINPYFQNATDIHAIITGELTPQLEGVSPGEIYFYGAGLSFENQFLLVKTALDNEFKMNAKVFHDLLGAARALCGRSEGIACILGTGSNSALYDGKTVTANIKSGGFILSDEGSGAHIGKVLARDFIYKRMPEEISKEMEYSAEELLDTIYYKPLPNRFVASLARIAGNNLNHPYIKNLVLGCFTEFLELRVKPYGKNEELSVGFIGSVAANFESILEDACKKSGLTKGKIMSAPMPGLVKYHLENQ